MDEKIVVKRLKLTPQEAADYIGVKLSYLYVLNHKKKIPHHKPGGRLVHYFQDELDEYLDRGKVAADYELNDQAADILRKRGRPCKRR